MFSRALKMVLGSKHEREVKKLQPIVNAIGQLEPKMQKLSDADLRARTADFKQKLANGAPLDDLLIPAFATVREASKRVLGMRHYDVQMIGGLVLHQGKIAEMRTGEGKTLVATLPCYLNALEGKGVHVVTVNDYLAQRDAEWMGRVHQFLGLSTGVALPRQPNAMKKRAYACDITYGQNNEFGFDYMRDNMKFSIYDYVQRELHYAIVDEVDSILIDEARTPLIISGPGETASEKYALITELVPRFKKDEHYELDEKSRSMTLSEEGMELAQRLLASQGLLAGGHTGDYRNVPEANLYDPANLQTLQILQQCLRANTLYSRDTHYMVKDGEVLIIDEHTGRTLPGRRWSEGLHQAVEAKERVEIQDENRTLATISFQNLFRLYNKLSGMTGTADTEAGEFHSIYKLDVVVIPTNKPIARQDHEDLVYKSEREKFKAVVEEIKDAHGRGQPVLVGTTSVEKSDVVSNLLRRNNIPHNVLNAKQHDREAYVVAQAGVPGAVTVATNMAGRGTDIVLGGNPEMLAEMDVMQNLAPEQREDREAVQLALEEAKKRYEGICKDNQKRALAAGGLHVVGTERHESRRIDNQLRGRSGRQGDPGSSRFYLSLQDDLMRIFAGERVEAMMDRMGMEEDVPIEHRWVTKSVENAQKKVEERNFDIRKNLLEYDDVMNQQRTTLYALRKQVLRGEYKTIPTAEERKKGVKPASRVTEADPEIRKWLEELLARLVRVHATTLAPPPQDAPEADRLAWQDQVFKSEWSALGTLRVAYVAEDVYRNFGCVVQVDDLANDPKKAYERLLDTVAFSLTEQRERLFDVVDELVVTLVERHCPEGKHYEDWKVDRLLEEYSAQFHLDATGIRGIADRQELARKMFLDVEGLLLRKQKQWGIGSMLRFFREIYLREIDKQWMDHLQTMDHLRDGIGLRGYGQRDPKKEYKREGYDLFMAMMRSMKSELLRTMFQEVKLDDTQLQRLAEERRLAVEARQKLMQGQHSAAAAAAAAGVAATVAPAGEAAGSDAQARASQPPQQRMSQPGPASRKERRAVVARGGSLVPGAPVAEPVTVKREGPKLGRNDPCHCGSGKKYKSCHYNDDRALEANGAG
jgi:preprotein translocase subunit SecA